MRKHQTIASLWLLITALSALGVHAQESANTLGKADAQYTADGRYIDSADLAQIIKRVTLPNGVVNPEFNKLVAKPSLYYTDFYGIEALKDFTKERLLHDFVPKYASVVSQDEHSVELRFLSGWTSKFYPNSALRIQATILPYDHMYPSGAAFTDVQRNLDEFRGIVEKEKWQDVYLVPNEHYEDELVVSEQWQKNPPPAKVTFDPELVEFSTQNDAVLIYPEYVHGNMPDYQKFLTFLGNHHNFDWLGMEMLGSDLQPALDIYSTADEKSPEFAAARQEIVQYFSSAWNGRFGKPTAGEDNEYFKIVELLHRGKTHIYGLESTSLAWIIFRYGQTPFGGAVRNRLWSQRVPATGRGIMHGGSAHFTEPQPANFQDFLQKRNQQVKFYTVGKRDEKHP